MATEPTPAHACGASHQERHVPLSWMLAVWAALVVLTGATVAAAQVDLGGYNTAVAVGIATVKALLVLLFFMHMIYERFTNFLVFCMALLFVTIFISFVLMDTSMYRPELIPDYAPNMRR